MQPSVRFMESLVNKKLLSDFFDFLVLGPRHFVTVTFENVCGSLRKVKLRSEFYS